MNITPPADDYGLQKLRGADRKRAVKPSDKVEAYPPIESSEQRHEPKEPLVARRQQRQSGGSHPQQPAPAPAPHQDEEAEKPSSTESHLFDEYA